MPVAHKNLDEIINPQPEALKVYQNLLAWIEEVGLASQRLSICPAFMTKDGDPIFPDDDRRWWLTDVQKRKPGELPAGDEDGPSSEDEEEKNDTDDEDPTIEEGEDQADASDPSFQTTRAFGRGAEHAERMSITLCGVSTICRTVSRNAFFVQLPIYTCMCL